MKKHMIWESHIDIEDWEDGYKEQKELGYIEDGQDIYEWASQLNYGYLGDERMNLNIPLEGKILVIADLGLFYGRRSAYKIIEKRNINAILTDDHEGEIEYFSDGRNIKGICRHHDGTNYYEYREIRKGKHIENLLNRLYYGHPVSRKMINYYTKSIAPQVNAVYGW